MNSRGDEPKNTYTSFSPGMCGWKWVHFKITLPQVQLNGLRYQLTIKHKKHRHCKQRLVKLHSFTSTPSDSLTILLGKRGSIELGLSVFIRWNINIGHVYPSGRLVLILACKENGHEIAPFGHFHSSFNCFYWLRELNSLDQTQLWKYGLTEV